MLLPVALLATCAAARGDDITFEGTSIALEGVRIAALSGDTITFVDGRGAVHERDLADIASISFDTLPALDRAETLLAEGETARAIDFLLAALVDAERDIETLWLHARLARAHDIRREWTEAVGHAAAVWLLDDDPAWVSLEPVCDFVEPSFTAARETMRRLDAARRTLKSPTLRPRAEALLRELRPSYDRLVASGATAPDEPTLSGRTPAAIRAAVEGDDEATQPEPPVDPPAETDDPPAQGDPDPDPPPGNGRRTPQADPERADAIDRMLDAGRVQEAYERCRAIERDPGDRDLARFLAQYGRVFVELGRPEDAAVMYLRCALLHPESPFAPRSCIQAAIIHRDIYDDHAAARRLLDRAVALATGIDRDDDVTRAREIMKTLRP